MGIALGLGLSAAGAIIGALCVWLVALGVIGESKSRENYGPPTITLSMGMFLLTSVSLFVASMVIMASIA